MTSLSEQLKSSKTAGSRVIFLSLKEEITTAIGDGWTIKDVWELLHEQNKFPFTYALFVRHFNRYCRDKEVIKPPVKLPPELPKGESSESLIVTGKPRKNPFVDPDPLASDDQLI